MRAEPCFRVLPRVLALVVALPLGLGCERSADWEDRVDATARAAKSRLEALAADLDTLEARTSERAESLRTEWADELAALEERRREIATEWEDARRVGGRRFREASRRLGAELAELEERARALEEHMEDPF